MRTFTKRFLAVVGFALATNISLSGQVYFSEDFQGVPGGGFPAGWALFNVDALTPATAVSYVTDAWIVREDFIAPVTPGDSSAFSTSWYTPAGTSNDYMISPAITIMPSSVLRWRALAPDASYPDGYEVRIGNAQNVAAMTTVLLTVPAEAQVWTDHTVDLAAAGFTSGTWYIAFRNNSVDEFILLVDDIEIEALGNDDAAVDDVVFPDAHYTIIPNLQDRPLDLGGTVRNNGVNALSNVVLNVTVYDGTFSPVSTASSAPLASLAAGASTFMNIGTWTFPVGVSDFYVFEYTVTHSVSDPNGANDTLYTSILIDDSTFARDDGFVTGGLGIGAGNGHIGQAFTLTSGQNITSVGAFITTGYTGRNLAATVYDFSSGLPNVVIALTDTLVYPDDSARYYVLPIHNGPYFLPAGQYAVTFIEFDSTIQIGNCEEIFNTGTTWVEWDASGGWQNFEAFGAAFQKPLALRAHLGDTVVAVTPAKPVDINVEAFPNPTNGKFVLDVNMNEAGAANIEIFDVHGRTVYSAEENRGNAFRRDIDLSSEAKGTYFIKVKSGTTTRMTKLVIN